MSQLGDQGPGRVAPYLKDVPHSIFIIFSDIDKSLMIVPMLSSISSLSAPCSIVIHGCGSFATGDEGG